MKGWRYVTLGDSEYFNILGSGIKKFDNTKDYLSTSSVERDKIIYVEKEISYKDKPSRANMQPVKDSVWFAKMKNTVKVLEVNDYIEKNTILSTGFCGIETKKIETSFLKQVFLSDEFNNQKDLLAEGTTQEAVNTEKVKQIKIFIPENKTEQYEIAKILNQVDILITQTNNLISKYNQIKSGLIQDLLFKGVDEKGNIRSEKKHEFKNSPFGKIPKEWVVKSISDYSEKITSGSRGWAKYYSVEGAKFIRIGNLKRGQIELDLSNVKYVHLPTNSAEGARTYLIPNDLLISITADLGIIAVVPENIGESYINQHIALVRFNHEDINSRFIGYFLSTEEAKRMIDNYNEGGTKAGLNLQMIGMLNFVKPKISEQNKIVSILDNINKLLSENLYKVEKLKKIKTGLMQDLLTGKVRVNDMKPEDVGIK